jgi:hypothetical protein
MNKPTGVSRRLSQCIKHFNEKDYEGALVNLFPAIDQTAKRRRKKDGVGKRIKAFLVEEEKLISILGTGNCFSNISVNGTSITDALYKFGRTPIAHEGELDPRLEFNESGAVQIGVEKWNLPVGYILGMCVATITAPENSSEHIDYPLSITVFGKTHLVSELWGNSDPLKKYLCAMFDDTNLFA